MLYPFIRYLRAFAMTLNDAFIDLIREYGSDGHLPVSMFMTMFMDYSDMREVYIDGDVEPVVKFVTEEGAIYDILDIKLDYAASVYEMTYCGLLFMTYNITCDADTDPRKSIYELFDRSGKLSATVDSDNITGFFAAQDCFVKSQEADEKRKEALVTLHKTNFGRYAFCVAYPGSNENGKAIFADYLSIYELMRIYDIIYQNRK